MREQQNQTLTQSDELTGDMTMSFYLDPMLKKDKSTARLDEPNINLVDVS